MTTIPQYNGENRSAIEATLLQAARDIAEALTNRADHWSAQPHPNAPEMYATLTSARDGATLEIEYNRSARRFIITGCFMDGLANHATREALYKRISVSAERPAAAIACEICARLLPDYRPALERAKQIKASREQAGTAARAFAGEIAAASGAEILKDQTDPTDVYIKLYMNAQRRVYAVFHTSGDDSIDFERLSIRGKQAAQLVAEALKSAAIIPDTNTMDN